MVWLVLCTCVKLAQPLCDACDVLDGVVHELLGVLLLVEALALHTQHVHSRIKRRGIFAPFGNR